MGASTDCFVKYGNNVANIGGLQNYSAGVYLVHHDASSPPGVYTTKGSGLYQAHVNVPTPYALSMIRIAVKHQHNDTDLGVVHSKQDQLNITVVPSMGDTTPSAPALNLSMFSDPAVAPDAYDSLEEGILRLGAKLLQYNPAEEPSDRAWAAGGYLALTLYQVLYPVYGGSTSLNSSGDAILVTFPSKPPLAQLGFWSLTVYDAKGYLIPAR